MKWSPQTIQKALQIRFACGSGYELLLDQGYPLPSVRTLQRRMALIDFECGILESVFEIMEDKVRFTKISVQLTMNIVRFDAVHFIPA